MFLKTNFKIKIVKSFFCSREGDSYNRDLKSHEILHPEYESEQEEEISDMNDNLDQIDNLKRKRDPSTNRDSTISANNSMKCEKCPFETKTINCYQEHVRNHQPRLIAFNLWFQRFICLILFISLSLRDGATMCRYCDYMLLTGNIYISQFSIKIIKLK